MIARSLLVAALVLACTATGCRKGSVESYKVPKEKDPEMPVAASGAQAPTAPTAAPAAGADANATMANTAVATAQGDGLSWTAPAGWRPKAASAMRKGSYTVPGNGGADGDLAITAFPGDVGGELANLNRWRGQIQLPPVSDLSGHVERIEANGLKFGVVNLVGSGANPNRILGAYTSFGGATWFFKLSGPDAVVTAAKPAFMAFLQTIKPASAQP